MSYTRDYLEKSAGVEELRGIMRSLGGTPRLLNKTQLIDAILKLLRRYRQNYRECNRRQSSF